MPQRPIKIGPKIVGLKPEPKSGTAIEKSSLALIHAVAESCQPKVVALSDLFEGVEETKDFKFVRVQCNDAKEAKVRALIIAMLTANYLRGPSLFARFYTLTTLA